MNFKEPLEYLIQILKDNSLEELEVQTSEYRIKLKSQAMQGISGQNLQALMETLSQKPASDIDGASSKNSSSAINALPPDKVVRSPFVGTFYEAPSPGAVPFVKVGQRVKKGDVLCIIEAMKIMNEIEAEQDGVIKEILVSNGSPVEYDQPLFIFE